MVSFEPYTLNAFACASYAIQTYVGAGPSRLKFELAVATDTTLPPMLSPIWLPAGSQGSNSMDSPTPEPLDGRMDKVTLPGEPTELGKQREKEVLRETVWHVVPLKSWMGEGRMDMPVEGEA